MGLGTQITHKGESYNMNENTQNMRRTDKEKDEKIVVRLPKYLKDDFREILILNDTNQSEVMRQFIKQYIRENKQKIKDNPTLF